MSLSLAECSVSAGQGIRVSWDYTIDGAVSILVRPPADPRGGIEKLDRRHQSFAWEHEQQSGTGSSTITFRLLSQSKIANDGLRATTGRSLADKPVDEERAASAEGTTGPTAHGGHDADNQSTTEPIADGANQDIHSDQDEDEDQDENENSPIGKLDALAILSGKVEEAWVNRLKTLTENLNLWFRDPGAFFGNIKFTVSEQWSFVSLYSIESKLYLDHRPFHKVHLAERLVELVKLKGNERNARKHLLSIIYIVFEKTGKKIDEKQKSRIRRRFEKYIASGLVLRSMISQGAGLLLTVAWFLNDKQ